MLLRHGKADSPFGVPDKERPLAARGKKQAAYAGAACRRLGLQPELVAVSPALRARETWDYVARELGAAPRVDIENRIYANTVDDLLGVVSEVPDSVVSFLIIGHNPSIADLALSLDARPDEGRTPLSDGFPTGTLAVFALEGSWSEVGAGVGQLQHVVRLDQLSST
jgi:phosphohistidine phosphatase